MTEPNTAIWARNVRSIVSDGFQNLLHRLQVDQFIRKCKTCLLHRLRRWTNIPKSPYFYIYLITNVLIILLCYKLTNPIITMVQLLYIVLLCMTSRNLGRGIHLDSWTYVLISGWMSLILLHFCTMLKILYGSYCPPDCLNLTYWFCLYLLLTFEQHVLTFFLNDPISCYPNTYHHREQLSNRALSVEFFCFRYLLPQFIELHFTMLGKITNTIMRWTLDENVPVDDDSPIFRPQPNSIRSDTVIGYCQRENSSIKESVDVETVYNLIFNSENDDIKLVLREKCELLMTPVSMMRASGKRIPITIVENYNDE